MCYAREHRNVEKNRGVAPGGGGYKYPTLLHWYGRTAPILRLVPSTKSVEDKGSSVFQHRRAFKYGHRTQEVQTVQGACYLSKEATHRDRGTVVLAPDISEKSLVQNGLDLTDDKYCAIQNGM